MTNRHISGEKRTPNEPSSHTSLTQTQIDAAVLRLRDPGNEDAAHILGAQDFDELMSTRAAIEQAKGMLMERFDLDSDGAFAFLCRLSQHTNRKLHDIAAELVATGQLPDDPTGS